MSYCVNCGVELDDSAKKCALCGAPVLNPYLDEPEEALPPPYPDRLALPEGTNRRYIAFLVSMVLLIPNLICGVANLLILDSGVWSAYIVSSSLLFWVFFIVPFLMENRGRSCCGCWIRLRARCIPGFITWSAGGRGAGFCIWGFR